MNLRHKLRGRIRQSYYLSKARYEILYHRRVLRDQEPIVIFQGGKVGSTTIAESLRRLNLGNPIYHVHFINGVDRRHKRMVNEFKLTHREYFARSKHFLVGQYLQREIKRGLEDKKWKVITLVRNPFEQRISSFFQIVDLIVPDFQERCLRQEISAEELAALFMRHMRPRATSSDWFDYQMAPVFGIDVFAHSFPTHQGYQIYHGERADLLLMRLEDLDRSAARAFKEFLGINEFSLVRRNIAATKHYAAVYKEFKKTIILPEPYIDAICADKGARHFYTAEELDQFRATYHH
ncbi:MAG TPA: putative capsular polysaccharide synthesis family protein [Gammaproteobacteria bacterium]|jgi:hypothetical protein|nr:putative capsular polysaccharide synthesis family protein [Gammaproteobacteria bacterium]HKH21146.1 putative capsular polysaccharide synthesis family protein [Gammaproteobacteria bacterium]